MQSVRPLAAELLDSAAALLAESFFMNPAHTYVCRDPHKRLAQLHWLLGGNLRLQPDLRASSCLADGLVVDAMGFWTRSTGTRPGTLRKIRGGLLAAPARLGCGGVRRLFEVTREMSRHLEHALGDRPYWYLNNMVVRDHLRGRGIGSRLLREQLPVMARLEPRYSIALSTQRPENVTFYDRLGFRPVLEDVVGGGPGAFRNWIMLYGPAA